jgi:hypothetical protein
MKKLFNFLYPDFAPVAIMLLVSMTAVTCSVAHMEEEEDPDDPSEVDEECRSLCFPEQWKMIDGECYCAVELG